MPRTSVNNFHQAGSAHCSGGVRMRWGQLRPDTCYDLRFPELATLLVDAGAQVLLVCSFWVPGDH